MRHLPILKLLAMSTLFATLASWVTGAEPLALGADAPAVKGVNQDNQPVDLGEVYKSGFVLVYFYPKAGTRGCTAQACSLRDEFAELSKEKLTIVGVSYDTVEEQKKFATENKLPFTLIADTKGEVYTAFGVPTRGNRQSFLLYNGKVVWRDLQASTAQQAADLKFALAAAKVNPGTPVTVAKAPAPTPPVAGAAAPAAGGGAPTTGSSAPAPAAPPAR